MTLRVVVRAPGVPPEMAAEFASTARLVFGVYARLRRRSGIPASSITAVLAGDFVAEVKRAMPLGTDFTTERAGGSATVAKNLLQGDDGAEVVIVFDADLWRTPGDDIDRLFRATVIGHELAHPIQSRAAYASGAMDGVELPSVTPYEGFRSASRILANEYRADRLAEIVVGAMATVDVAGATRPFPTWLFRDRSYLDGLVSLLAAAHPKWPDLVDRYRDREIPIEEMFYPLAAEIDQTLTLLMHSQALADAADANVELLALPELASLPAVRLYLAEPLEPFMSLVRSAPAIASLSETRKLEREFTRVGLAAHLEIYRRLGINPRDTRRPAIWIDVDGPLR
jgi:hypothetical protein